MKAVILAGGLGSRISEESIYRPKPLVEIGGKPILWHIMKIYSYFGVNDFIICCGYKGYLIKEYFSNYFLHNSDVTFDVASNEMHVHQTSSEPWKVTVVDTGEVTQTGGRLKRVRHYLENEEAFCFTYGDGVSNIHIGDLISFHKCHGKAATVSAVRPPGRYGSLLLDNDRVSAFEEKPLGDGSWISGGFFVLNPSVFDLISGDDTPWEQSPLRSLVSDKQLVARKHFGFWQSMDTVRDKNVLEELWLKGSAPWRLWS
mgnify:CR=1 FL=1